MDVQAQTTSAEIPTSDRDRMEDVGFMTCMTLVWLGNYAQTGHFGGPLAYTPFNVVTHLAGRDRGGLGYDYRRPKHPYADKFMLAAGHCAPTCYALWMIMGEALARKYQATGDSDGLPWVSPVEFACDEDLRFYWFSAIDARHSQNVRANPRAALSIYDCTQTPLSRAAQGVYGEGSVEEFHRSELEPLLPSIERWISWRDAGRKTPRPRRPDQLDGDSPFRFYRVTAAKLYALHPNGHPAHGKPFEWRVPVDLTDSFSRAYRSAPNTRVRDQRGMNH